MSEQRLWQNLISAWQDAEMAQGELWEKKKIEEKRWVELVKIDYSNATVYPIYTSIAEKTVVHYDDRLFLVTVDFYNDEKQYEIEEIAEVS